MPVLSTDITVDRFRLFASWPILLGTPCVLLLCGMLSVAALRASPPSQQALAPAPALAPGVVIERVVCAANPQQSYALYLPKSYSPARKWPVLFAFDPLARGKVPVDLAREAAERYGYIVVGSNNSRNGPTGPEHEAAKAMIEDVLTRFALDTARIYVTGFSGGARVATSVALLCKTCIAGVFAHGAGFPTTSGRDISSLAASSEIHFSYFSAGGDLDFNYAELSDLSRKLDELGVPNRFRRFSGPHQWAPAEVWTEALAWMELRAMKEGRREKDVGLIATELAAATERARRFEDSGNLPAAWDEYGKSAELFDGLAGVTALAARAAELKTSPALRKAQKEEVAAIRRQRELVGNLVNRLNALSSSDSNRLDLLTQIRAGYTGVREAANSKKVTPEVLGAQRALREVNAVTYESGDEALRTSNFSLAETYFQLLADVLPERPGPHVLLARVHAAAGRRKQALGELKRAVEKGLRDPDALRDTTEFNSLRDDAQFKDLLARVEHQAETHPPS